MRAILVLENGHAFRGTAYGALGETFGEAVFTTGTTGYQETLTDPSYCRQVVVQTAPHVGNTGINDEDSESERIWVAGYVVRDPARRPSSWRALRTLEAELDKQGIVGISEIDTRALARHLREQGAMRVGISSVESDPGALLQRVLSSPGMVGADLAGEVTTPQAYVVPPIGLTRFRVVAVDLGIKRTTVRQLAERGVEVHVVPATSSSADILERGPDAVFFSNGPGDPAACEDAVDALRGVLAARLPVFGICLGHQMLGRALGFSTYKLKYGHRGINQPVLDLATGKVEITAHNHGFAVAAPDANGPNRDHRQLLANTRPEPPVITRTAATTERSITETAFGRVGVSHICLNDGVVEGLRCLDVPAFSVQYHPEAAAGPHDAAHLFDRFVASMESGRPVVAGAC